MLTVSVGDPTKPTAPTAPNAVVKAPTHFVFGTLSSRHLPAHPNSRFDAFIAVFPPEDKSTAPTLSRAPASLSLCGTAGDAMTNATTREGYYLRVVRQCPNQSPLLFVGVLELVHEDQWMGMAEALPDDAGSLQ